MNTQALKARMVEYGDTQNSLAKAIGVELGTLNKKINGKSERDFRQREIRKIKERYRLTAEEVCQIFFTDGHD